MRATIRMRNAIRHLAARCDLTVEDSPRRDRRTAGITLFEILLVLILLVVVGSLTTPLMEGTFASVRLRRATDQVLAAWAEVRTRAIEDGQVYQFRFREGHPNYRVDRWYSDESYQEREVNKTTEDSQAVRNPINSADESEEVEWKYEALIPETVVFAGGERAVIDETGMRDVESFKDQESARWSAPILFFPDGTTSEASILLGNNKNRYQRATLRSLTGVARKSELLSAEDLAEQKSR